MALRGKKPETVEKRLKALFFGLPGVGKTTAAIQFPAPYMIDTERGSENDQYVEMLSAKGGAIFQTSDPDEMMAEVTSLLTEKHNFKTLIIDPLTIPYNEMLDKSAKSLTSRDDPTGTAFSRHKQVPDRKIKHLLNLLLRLDMNVIITSHAKAEWKDGKQTGEETYDCYNKLDYLFDLAVNIQKRGSERVGVVRKSRIQSFEDREVFPFSYDEIAERYGRKVLERGAVAEVLASAEQCEELQALLAERVNGVDMLEKWLDKAKAESIEELPADVAAKCIAFLASGKKVTA
jgi:hypothetical protein